MAKSDLLDELKGGQTQFTLVGKAIVKDGSLAGEIMKEGKTWKHVDSSIIVDTGDSNNIFVRIWGGYKIDNPVLIKFNNGEKHEIPWSERFEEHHLDKLSYHQKLTAGLERDADGKLIIKEFINEIDFEAYLREHLADGMEIRARGEAEYSPGKDGATYRRFNLKSVYAVEEYTDKDGVFQPVVYEATLRQTYLADENSLSRRWEKELEKDGETLISLFVPQYLSQKKVGEKYVPYKRTDPLPQDVKLVANLDDERDLKIKKAVAKMLFEVGRNTVREVVVNVKIVDGYETVTGAVEVTKDLQELIDLGVLTLEQVQKQATIRGTRVSELVYSVPAMRKLEDGTMSINMTDDKYSPQVLMVPEIDGEVEVKKVDDSNADVNVTEEEFAKMFEM